MGKGWLRTTGRDTPLPYLGTGSPEKEKFYPYLLSGAKNPFLKSLSNFLRFKIRLRILTEPPPFITSHGRGKGGRMEAAGLAILGAR